MCRLWNADHFAIGKDRLVAERIGVLGGDRHVDELNARAWVDTIPVVAKPMERASP